MEAVEIFSERFLIPNYCKSTAAKTWRGSEALSKYGSFDKHSADQSLAPTVDHNIKRH
jgi:hypothetical protein